MQFWLLRYITKDGNYVLFGITPQHLKILIDGTSTSLAQIAADIQEDPNITNIALKHPAKFILWGRGMSKLCSIYNEEKAQRIYPLELPIPTVPPCCSELHSWFITNFFRCDPKPLRSRQLFLHGPTQLGKSRFLAFLAKHFRGFIIPREEKYMDLWQDHNYDYMVRDELHAGHKITWWNAVLDGQPVNFPVKGTQVIKRKNVPIVCCSNSSLAEIYHRVALHRTLTFAAFETRFLVFDLAEYGSIHRYVDWLETLAVITPSDD